MAKTFYGIIIYHVETSLLNINLHYCYTFIGAIIFYFSMCFLNKNTIILNYNYFIFLKITKDLDCTQIASSHPLLMEVLPKEVS